ncbi:Chitin elicitor receptor kinase [Actinidia chinensis var. chinensis]|uniref:Chitin elicitor receptor kinase n=1 Tax=Actinidia chinensis var. chinensis TaxID=1590841 RepID=A0A2R6QGH8_ACTCC|nr:Chitin elicitor receptor kinase [Actinidia chinensis var. chinensis]
MSKLKHSLISFSLEELRIATEDFSPDSAIGRAMYRGRIGGSYLAIEQITEEAGHRVVSILTKINHLNVVKLEGCCYGTKPYLVYEFVEKGSLRDNLNNSKMAKQLTWAIRMQIVFDLAVGLHYIHYCTKPAYVHRNINSKNVLITADRRAKISGFRLAKPLICSEEKEEPNWNESVIVGDKGYLAPEYLTYGQASIKVDVYAFGVVLLELLSAKEAIENGNLLKDATSFLADEALVDSSGCLDKLKQFMDPTLLGEYPLGDAICLALLAKGCVEENPLTHHE